MKVRAAAVHRRFAPVGEVFAEVGGEGLGDLVGGVVAAARVALPEHDVRVVAFGERADRLEHVAVEDGHAERDGRGREGPVRKAGFAVAGQCGRSGGVGEPVQGRVGEGVVVGDAVVEL
ncbi:hypothetical protein [Glycomyces paridis]|uniref:hypothetical protein n=1 Tax=Glycomyces paridis TaxID=2126555 RepID=UPI001F026C5E|nr:hypothetical protein [Glycomyces paridis]